MSTNINKKLYESFGEYEIYTVNPKEVRDTSLDMEEYGVYGFNQWFKSIPKNEIWIDETLDDEEKQFAIANCLTQLKYLRKGKPEGVAYDRAIKVEKAEREKVDGTHIFKKKDLKELKSEYKKILNDIQYRIVGETRDGYTIWLVDGHLIRDKFYCAFIEGGNHQRYWFIPKEEIWLEKTLDKSEVPFILIHEYVETMLMKFKHLTYDEAHKIASKVEFNYRKKFPSGISLEEVIDLMDKDWALKEADNPK